MKPLTRRAFLDRALRLGAGAATWSSTAGMLGLAARTAQAAVDDYKALVCVYLYGGNDGFNWLVPHDVNSYATYALARTDLAISRSQLLALTPTSGIDVGLHPACPQLASLFQQGRAAFVANCGVLRAPTTRDDYAHNRSLPPSLFSHADQMDWWMSGVPGQKSSGWAGRIDQLLASRNGSSPLALNLSLSGSSLLQSGGTLPAYILNANGAELIGSIHNNSSNYYPYLGQATLADASVNPLERALGRSLRNAFDVAEVVTAALQDTTPPTAPFDTSTDIGANLRMAAYLIAAHQTLGIKRQVYLVGLGGFDTHDSQSVVQPRLLSALDSAIAAFQTQLDGLGMADQVTLFTLSDFGRTLTVNGDGTDHGWGNHHLVVGGAVRGKEIYGRMPDLTLEGPDDAGFGRIIPTTSVDQYVATIASWFGVALSDLTTVFPNLPQFTPRRLGFMAGA